jgi:hypothetical protein
MSHRVEHCFRCASFITMEVCGYECLFPDNRALLEDPRRPDNHTSTSPEIIDEIVLVFRHEVIANESMRGDEKALRFEGVLSHSGIRITGLQRGAIRSPVEHHRFGVQFPESWPCGNVDLLAHPTERCLGERHVVLVADEAA